MLCYSTPTNLDMDSSAYTKTGVTSFDSENGNVRMMIRQPDGRSLRSHGQPKPKNYIELAVVVLICFNIPLGVIAVVLSMKSNRDFEEGNFDSARIKGKISVIISVVGIITTISIIMLAIFWPLIVRGNTRSDNGFSQQEGPT